MIILYYNKDDRIDLKTIRSGGYVDFTIVNKTDYCIINKNHFVFYDCNIAMPGHEIKSVRQTGKVRIRVY